MVTYSTIRSEYLIQLTKICLMCLVLIWHSVALAKPQRWRATWWSDPATTMAIGWEQSEGGEAKFTYRERSPRSARHTSHTITVRAPTEREIKHGSAYWAQVTGLKPDTAYEFEVGVRIPSDELIEAESDGYRWSEPMWFKTAPAQPQRLTFIAGGDSRNHRSVRQTANRVVAELEVDAVLFGGDFTARDTLHQWREWFDDWQLSISESGRLTPLIPARGNHDSESQLSRAWGRAYPHFYFALTFGGDLLRIYTLNSERPAGGDQRIWLERDLKHHRATRLRWAQYHKPMRPHTKRKSEGEDEYLHWADLFDHHQVDLAVECDSHLMKVTWPLRPESRGVDGFKRARTGTTYIGEGGWGAPLRSVDDNKPWTFASDRLNHLFFIEVSAQGEQRITPLRLLSARDREQMETPYPWLTFRGLPQEIARLTEAAPLMLKGHRATPGRDTLRLGYGPLTLAPRGGRSTRQATPKLNQ